VWLGSLADGIKLIFKEDLIPADGDRILFRLAPYLAFVPAVCAFIALPFATAYVFRELDVALIFILAMLGIEVIGVILAGWASNNKWSVYGAMREACQMVSYEAMGMSLLIPVMTAGRCNWPSPINRGRFRELVHLQNRGAF
jgi:NADH-quinone oxidoreductase subunit H